MAGVTNESLVVGKVYAGSMLDLAEQKGEGEFLLDELTDLAEMVEKDPGLHRFFMSPTVDSDSRKGSIEKVFRGRASDLLVNSLQVLNAKDRLSLFPSVVEAYRILLRDHQNRIEVGVSTAVPLSEEARVRIAEMASAYTGKEVLLVEKIDEHMLGGLVIQIGDEKFDASVSKRIHNLSHRLRERAMRELHGGRAYVE